MKTKYFIFAAIAAVGLVGCTNDDFVGDLSPNVVEKETPGTEGMINFGGGFKAVTRAGNHVGADAADLLGSKFIVSGFKGTSTQATTTVFDNYLVEWAANTAGTTESNTCDWEYVGKTSPVTGTTLGTQTIKYWDFSQALYDFIAYAPGKGNTVITTGTPGDNQVLVSAIDAENVTTKAYTIKGKEAALTKSYIADRVTVEKANYKKDVVLNFRALAAKVRLGIYETVPGYSVKDVKFYTEDLGQKAQLTTGASETSATLIGTFNTGGEYTVTFKADPDDKAYVSLNAAGYTADTYRGFGALTYGAKERNETGSAYLKRTASEPSYANNGVYTTVLPIGENTASTFELFVDYTLEAIDNGETITVHGAKAFVPATYTQWLPNYAYTYIFKISDNSNGWTDPDDFDNEDKAGLFPITFDAVVTDSEELTQSTITTVSTPSITAYQNGRSLSADEFANGDGDIYVQVMKPGTSAWELATDLNTNGQLYSLGALTTEAMVMDALNIVASTAGDVTTGRNGVVLTKVTTTLPTSVPRKDGNNFTVAANSTAQFSPSATTNYAYVYKVSNGTASNVYTAVQLTGASAPSEFTTTYYVKQSDNTFRAAVAGDYKDGGYFYTKYTNNNNVYAVKVIKVQ